MNSAHHATVVLITRDRREEVLRTLHHMTAIPDSVPIVAVDNGSTDGTAVAISRRFPEVTLIRSDRNLGAVGRNLAIERVETPYVAFCDDDTRWEPGALSKAADLLDQYPGLAGVMGHCVVEPQMTDDPLVEEVRNSPVPGPDWLPGPALMSFMAGTTMLRLDAFRRAGGFCPRMWLGGEEELLSIDLVVRGWWLCWIDDIIVRHAPSQIRDARRRRQLGIRNTLWTTWLRRPMPSALRRSAAVLSSATKDRHTCSAVLEALGGASWILRERKVVPSDVERRLRALESSQRTSRARRYIG